MYSIKAVAHATGLTVETLRAWERRYGVIRPERDATGRRVYGAADVVRLRRLREATERGHPIGRIAGLTDAQLSALLADLPERQNRAAANAFVARMLDAASRYSTLECEQALTLAIALLPPGQLIEDVLEPVLREVGERWHAGVFTIAQERLVSACIRRHAGLMLDTYERMARGPAIVFGTLSGERHELGLLLSALFAASRGFRCHYLGPDLPPDELARYAGRVQAAAVAISVVLASDQRALVREIERLAAGIGPQVRILIGGGAAGGLAASELPAQCALLADQIQFKEQLNLLSDART